MLIDNSLCLLMMIQIHCGKHFYTEPEALSPTNSVQNQKETVVETHPSVRSTKTVRDAQAWRHKSLGLWEGNYAIPIFIFNEVNIFKKYTACVYSSLPAGNSSCKIV